MRKNTSKDAATAKSLKTLKPRTASANTVRGGNRSQAEKRLSDHRNELRRNWAP